MSRRSVGKVKEEQEYLVVKQGLTVLGGISVGDTTRNQIAAGLTAGTTQTQAGATQLAIGHNVVGTCANASDGVKLPQTAGFTTEDVGLLCSVSNLGAAVCKVWPGTTAKIKGGTTDAADTVTLVAAGAAGSSKVYILNFIAGVANWDLWAG